jgi:hypothetical protein
MMVHAVWLPLPCGLAPVSYSIEAVIADTTQSVGELHITGSDSCLAARAVARYGGFKIVDVEWTAPEFKAGLWALAQLVWQMETSSGRDYLATVRLVDWRGRVVAEQTSMLGTGNYPARAWRDGDTVRTNLAIRLPFDAGGPYLAQISLSDSNGALVGSRPLGRKWANLGWIRVAPWPLQRELPTGVNQPAEAIVFGEAVDLVAYSVNRERSRLVVDLYWRSDRVFQEELGVFLHLGPAGTPPLLQSSGGPAEWSRPTSSWRPGEIIHDRRTILLPDDLPLAELSISVGLFHLDEPNLRLPLTVGGRSSDDNAYYLSRLP